MIDGAAAAIRETRVPYLAIMGEELSPEDAAWMRKNVPHAQTEVWPRSGHFPHMAHPRRFAELLAKTRKWAPWGGPGDETSTSG